MEMEGFMCLGRGAIPHWRISRCVFTQSIVFTFHLVFRREQSLDKKYPGLFKHHSSRQSSSSNSMDKLIKKRNVPQKLPTGKRCCVEPH